MTRQTSPKLSTRNLSPEDFPRGFAETDGFGYLEVVDTLRRARDPSYVPPTREKFPQLLLGLEYGEIFDAGLEYYGEFFTNLEYGWFLLHEKAIHMDGVAGTVSVVARYSNAVQLKWRAL